MLHQVFPEGGLTVPGTVTAGSAFSIQSSGSGGATLYITGMGHFLKRDVQLGQSTLFPAGSIYNAGHYLVVLTGTGATVSSAFDVVPASEPENLSFLARPSRLPVDLHNGITGALYVFDAYKNLITVPKPVLFQLSNPAGATEARTVMTRDGAAWTQMDSTSQQGMDKFVARVDDGISSTRIVGQIPGDPCGLKMAARESGGKIQLQTDPVRDCSGNAVPDGTIVTFTESDKGAQSTVDVPIKRGVAEAELPAHSGATISVASGVVLGNQIRWAR
jgi:hypothetical protein